MHNKHLFLCFCGIDGSGKTTIIKIVQKELLKNNVPLKYHWCRHEFLLLSALTFMSHKIRHFSKPVEHGKDKVRETTKMPLLKYFVRSIRKSRTLFRILFIYVTISYFIQIQFKARLSFNLKDIIACDRYVYDTIIDMLSYQFSSDLMKSMVNLYLKIFPKPSIVFYVDVPEKVAFERKKELNIVELKMRRKLYTSLFNYLRKLSIFKIIFLDGTRELGEIKRAVLNSIEEFLK